MYSPFPIPAGWEDRIREHVRARTGGEREWLSVLEFGHDVLLRFPDSSHAYFRFALVMRDDAADQVAVFTEHCGYHVFPATDLQVLTIPLRGQADAD